jgi:hypothetical protein
LEAAVRNEDDVVALCYVYHTQTNRLPARQFDGASTVIGLLTRKSACHPNGEINREIL